MTWLHVMKGVPLVPLDPDIYICSLCAVDECFERDLKVHVTVAIGYKFCNSL